MGTTNRHSFWRNKNGINFYESGVKFGLFAILSLNIFTGIAQQKVTNQQQWEQDLVVLNQNIQRLDAAILAINNRIAGIPAADLDPSVSIRLGDIELQREQLLREKHSIEAALNPQGTNLSFQLLEIPKSTFSSLPQANQEQILAHPERYIVIEN